MSIPAHSLPSPCLLSAQQGGTAGLLQLCPGASWALSSRSALCPACSFQAFPSLSHLQGQQNQEHGCFLERQLGLQPAVGPAKPQHPTVPWAAPTECSRHEQLGKVTTSLASSKGESPAWPDSPAGGPTLPLDAVTAQRDPTAFLKLTLGVKEGGWSSRKSLPDCHSCHLHICCLSRTPRLRGRRGAQPQLVQTRGSES